MVLAACILGVLYPYAIYPAVLTLLPKVPVEPRPAPRMRFSLLFCAFNESNALDVKIPNLEALRKVDPELQVLAYDDGSLDDTLTKLSERPDLVEVFQGSGRLGKAHGMKVLAGQAVGDVLIFTDANVTLREDALERLSSWFSDPEVGGVCGTLRYVNADDSSTAAVGGAYWRLEEKIKTLESRTGNVMGADGSIFAVRRELYPDFPDTVLDDLTVSMAAVFAGKRLLKVDDVVAHERLVTDRKDEFSRKARIAARAYHTHRVMKPQLRTMSRIDTFKYVSHKVIRWFGGLFVIIGTVAAIGLATTVAPFLGLAALVAVAASTVIAAKVKSGPIAALAEIVIALLATLLGVLRAARGRTYSTWAPAGSR
ncbi:MULTISPECIES: glycosyltransferase [Aeromicrobium]|uniref:glycosyltransferase n=1 Tax=Aeromicrobium TaxID=2040 RepID=UPI001930F665|nr:MULTISPECIES: glycosyltransferase [Aeromicrobium]